MKISLLGRPQFLGAITDDETSGFSTCEVIYTVRQRFIIALLVNVRKDKISCKGFYEKLTASKKIKKIYIQLTIDILKTGLLHSNFCNKL